METWGRRKAASAPMRSRDLRARPQPSCPRTAPSPYPVLQRVRVDEVGQHVAEPERQDVSEEPGDEAAGRGEKRQWVYEQEVAALCPTAG